MLIHSLAIRPVIATCFNPLTRSFASDAEAITLSTSSLPPCPMYFIFVSPFLYLLSVLPLLRSTLYLIYPSPLNLSSILSFSFWPNTLFLETVVLRKAFNFFLKLIIVPLSIFSRLLFCSSGSLHKS